MKSQTTKLTYFEKCLTLFAKRWLMPDDKISISLEGKFYQVFNQCEEGYPMRLFFVRGIFVVAMWTHDTDSDSWIDETCHAKDCYSGEAYLDFSKVSK